MFPDVVGVSLREGIMGRIGIRTLGGCLAAAGLDPCRAMGAGDDLLQPTNLDAFERLQTQLTASPTSTARIFHIGRNVPTSLEPACCSPLSGSSRPATAVVKDPCIESGYNTDGNEQFETKDDGGTNWNHSLLLSNVGTETDRRHHFIEFRARYQRIQHRYRSIPVAG